MRVFYVIGLLRLINGQVNSLPTSLDEKEIYSKFEEWWNEKAEEIINEIKESTTHAQSLLDKQITEGKVKIEKTTADAFHELHSRQELIGADCYHQGLQQLDILKTASISEFLHCERLKEGLQDIGQMFKETYNVTADFVRKVKDAVTGLTKCNSGNQFTDTWCVMQYIWKLKEDINSVVPSFTAYGQDIKRLATEIKDIYEFCMHPDENKVNKQVAAILEGSKLCAMNQ